MVLFETAVITGAEELVVGVGINVGRDVKGGRDGVGRAELMDLSSGTAITSD